MELKIEGISHNGEGVARNEGKVIFVPYAIPGEIVQVDIVEEKKKYSRSILTKLIKKSPHRIEPKCPYYYKCGGCSYQHINYNQQLLYKKEITQETLNRIGKIEVPVFDMIGMQKPWNYRNKVVWHINDSPAGKKMGFYRYQSKQLIEIDSCPLLLPKLNRISSLIKDILPEIDLEEDGSIMLRQSNYSDQIILEFIECYASREIIKKLSREVDIIYEKRKGKTKLITELGLIKEKAGKCYFLLGVDDFFQVNAKQSEIIIDIITKYLNLNKKNKVLDAYCGVGMFALNVAEKIMSVFGIDVNSSTIKNARRNAELNGITNCQFITGACENVLIHLNKDFDRVIIDPPRTGLKPKVIDLIINASPEKILYVSCNPGTLARDLKQFVLNGYEVFAVQPIDMFPQTSHIENVVALQRE
jgi:23S rRNA (uracil1939-C5)-methyltransferase